MSSLINQATIQIRRDSASAWTSADHTPSQGEWCLETDTKKIKIGDGVTAWTSLNYTAIDDIDGELAAKITGSTDQIAKAWVNFNGTGTVAINDSYNVSSITDNNVGDYTINFSTALSDSNYTICSGPTTAAGTSALSVSLLAAGTGSAPTLKTSSAFRIIVHTTIGVDVYELSLAVFNS